MFFCLTLRFFLFVSVVDFSDEQMLVDMVRENVTQRDSDFHDTGESIVLARCWLHSKCNGVKLFNTVIQQKRKNDGTFDSSPDSYRSIARFLSKQGKTISYVTVKNYLNVFDNLHPDLLVRVRKVLSGGDKKEGDVTVKQKKNRKSLFLLFHKNNSFLSIQRLLYRTHHKFINRTIVKHSLHTIIINKLFNLFNSFRW